MYVLTCRMKAPVSIEQAFEVFESPYNLAKITPKWLHFRITTPGRVVIRQGAEQKFKPVLYVEKPGTDSECRSQNENTAITFVRHAFNFCQPCEVVWSRATRPRGR